ncbi:hypothetical protein [Streptomyces anthocyanicus]|uniref:hypothetical protein n=1 Tax=Streptomyces anthocyanicus TaxID=68174 RepID=UPI00216B30C4|nr:hypothetical protein [Streptomyces anthocyanicus]
MNDAVGSSMPGPDGTTVASALPVAVTPEATAPAAGAAASAVPTNTPASNTLVAVPLLLNLFLNSAPTPDSGTPPRIGGALVKRKRRQ